MKLKSVRGDPLPWVSGVVFVLSAARNRAWIFAYMMVVRQSGPYQEWPPRHRNLVHRGGVF
jgi:hypothetical protein